MASYGLRDNGIAYRSKIKISTCWTLVDWESRFGRPLFNEHRWVILNPLDEFHMGFSDLGEAYHIVYDLRWPPYKTVRETYEYKESHGLL